MFCNDMASCFFTSKSVIYDLRANERPVINFTGRGQTYIHPYIVTSRLKNLNFCNPPISLCHASLLLCSNALLDPHKDAQLRASHQGTADINGISFFFYILENILYTIAARYVHASVQSGVLRRKR